MRAVASLLVVALLPAAGEAHRCFVRGERASLDRVVVRPAGAAPFAVALHELAMLVVPGRRVATVHVVGPIAFRAAAPGVEYSVAREIHVARDMVRLAPGARVRAVAPHGGALHGVAMLAGSIEVRDVDVACSALTVDEVAPPHDSPPDDDAPSWRPARRSLVLRARPHAGAAVRIFSTDPAAIFLVETGQAGGWLRVRFEDAGSRVEGWAPRAALLPAENRFGTLVGDAIGDCFGADGFSSDVFDGMATVGFGTTVFAAPGRGPWGSIRTGEPVHVVHVRGETFAAIADLPGIDETCGTLSHAFVRAGDVAFPASAGERL